jgi:GTPase SAR1 family protein
VSEDASSAPRQLGAHLEHLCELIGGLGEDHRRAAGQLAELGDRLAGQCFHLAVLGQFKRGKSTLINAILGEKILPTSIVPLTSVPTYIVFGPRRELQVRRRDAPLERREFNNAEQALELLSELVTEPGNPENVKRIEHVRLSHPAGILEQTVLVDTPGIGSTFRHNTEVTLEFLSQCDAALFVVSADPPITEVELDFLGQVRERVEKVFFVMNKVDYLSAEELAQAVSFLKDTLQGRAAIGGEIIVYPLAARSALQARMKNDPAELASSGIEPVERDLLEFLAHEKQRALGRAIEKKARDLVGEEIMKIRLRLRSLKMPLEELEEKLAVFDRKIEQAHTQRRTAGDLLAGDEQRARDFVEQQALTLRDRAGKHLSTVLGQAVERFKREAAAEQDVAGAIQEAIPELFGQATRDLSGLVARRVDDVLAVHQERAANLVEGVRRAAAELFDVPYHPPESGDVFNLDTRLYWQTDNWKPSFSPLPEGSLDRLLPRQVRASRLAARWEKKLATLVVENTETLRWQILGSLQKAFAAYRNALDKHLVEVIEATHGAMRAAFEKRKHHAGEISERFEQDERAAAELDAWMSPGQE